MERIGYRLGGKTYSDTDVMKVAKEQNMSLDEFVRTNNMEPVQGRISSYSLGGKNYNLSDVEQVAKENKVSVDDFIKNNKMQPVYVFDTKASQPAQPEIKKKEATPFPALQDGGANTSPFLSQSVLPSQNWMYDGLSISGLKEDQKKQEVSNLVMDMYLGDVTPKKLSDAFQNPDTKETLQKIVSQVLPQYSDLSNPDNIENAARDIVTQNRHRFVELSKKSAEENDNQIKHITTLIPKVDLSKTESSARGFTSVLIPTRSGQGEFVSAPNQASTGSALNSKIDEINGLTQNIDFEDNKQVASLISSFQDLDRLQKEFYGTKITPDQTKRNQDVLESLKRRSEYNTAVKGVDSQLKRKEVTAENQSQTANEIDDKLHTAVLNQVSGINRFGGNIAASQDPAIIEQVKLGLSNMKDTDPKQYNLALKAIKEKGELPPQIFEQAANTGQDIYNLRTKIRESQGGDNFAYQMFGTTNDYTSSETKKAYWAGKIAEKAADEIKKGTALGVRLSMASSYSPSEVNTLASMVGAPKGASDELAREEQVKGYDAIPKSGYGEALYRGAANVFGGVANTVQTMMESPVETYLRKSKLQSNISQLIPTTDDKGNVEMSDKIQSEADSTAIGAVEGMGQFIAQVASTAGFGGLALGGTKVGASLLGAAVKSPAVTRAIIDYAGTASSMFAQTYGDAYADYYKKTGGNNALSHLAGVISGGIQAATELILPDIQIARIAAGRGKLVDGLVDLIKEGGDISLLKKKAMPLVGKFAESFASTIASENLEELTGQIGDYVQNVLFDPDTAKDRDLGQEVWDTFVGTTVSMALPAILGAAGAARTKDFTRETLTKAAYNPQAYLGSLINLRSDNVITDDEYNLGHKLLTTHYESLKEAPVYDASGNELSEADKNDFAFESTKTKIYSDRAKESKTTAEKNMWQNRIKESEKIQEEMLNRKRETATEQPAETPEPVNEEVAPQPEKTETPEPGSALELLQGLRQKYGEQTEQTGEGVTTETNPVVSENDSQPEGQTGQTGVQGSDSGTGQNMAGTTIAVPLIGDLIGENVRMGGKDGSIKTDSENNVIFDDGKTERLLGKTTSDEFMKTPIEQLGIKEIPKFTLDGDNVTIDGKAYSIQSFNDDNDGNLVSLTLKDTEGKTVTMRNKNLALDIAIERNNQEFEKKNEGDVNSYAETKSDIDKELNASHGEMASYVIDSMPEEVADLYAAMENKAAAIAPDELQEMALRASEWVDSAKERVSKSNSTPKEKRSTTAMLNRFNNDLNKYYGKLEKQRKSQANATTEGKEVAGAEKVKQEKGNKGNVVSFSNQDTTVSDISKEKNDIATKAKENGTWMKAPNGKKSNLSEDQWTTVRTKNFKDWFGDWETLASQNKIKSLYSQYKNIGDDLYKRLRPEEEQGRIAGGETNVIASAILSRLHKATRQKFGDNSKELATIKANEEKYLESFARDAGVWKDKAEDGIGERFDGGQENEVFLNKKDTKYVTKLNNLNLNENWLQLLDRIALHDTYFPSTKYELDGFGRDKDGNFVAILKQQFIEGVPLSHQEIVDYMEGRGFELLSKYDESLKGTDEEFNNFIDKHNGIIVEDLHLNNVRKGNDKNQSIFIIDPVISLDTKEKGYGGDREPGKAEFDTGNVSKVVDENGEPLVMYHGTSKDADFFSFKIPDNGTWFTKDRESAESYSKDNDSMKSKFDQSTGKYVDVNNKSRVIPVFLNVRNVKPVSDIASKDEIASMQVASNYKRLQKNLFNRERFTENNADAINFNLKDGAGVDFNSLAVIGKPNQIKSATENTGVFSEDSNDIRFQQKVADQSQKVNDFREAIQQMIKEDGGLTLKQAQDRVANIFGNHSEDDTVRDAYNAATRTLKITGSEKELADKPFRDQTEKASKDFNPVSTAITKKINSFVAKIFGTAAKNVAVLKDSKALTDLAEKRMGSYQVVGERGISNLGWAARRSILNAKDVAEKMERKKKSEKEIKIATGWERGAGGKWRYEIPDELQNVAERFTQLTELKPSDNPKGFRLKDILGANSNILKMYPELADLLVTKQGAFMDMFGSTQGWFNHEFNVINLTPYSQNPESTFLHELQHAIQYIEGFPLGGNSDIAINQVSEAEVKSALDNAREGLMDDLERVSASVERLEELSSKITDSDKAKINDISQKFNETEDNISKKYDGLKKADPKSNPYDSKEISDLSRESLALRQQLKTITDKYTDMSSIFFGGMSGIDVAIKDAKERMTDMAKKIGDLTKITTKEGAIDALKAMNSKALFDAYQRLAGEVESRNVEKRMKMTPEERRSSLLSETEGIDRESQIVVNNINDGQNSIEYMYDRKGEVLGFVDNRTGEIFLNGEKLNGNTVLHEAGHIYLDWLEKNPSFGNNEALFNRGMELTERSDYLRKIKTSKFYKEQAKNYAAGFADEGTKEYKEAYDRYMKKEALANAIGDNGAGFLLSSKRGTFREWLNQFWKQVGDFFGIKDKTPREIKNMTLDEFSKGIAADILDENSKFSEDAKADEIDSSAPSVTPSPTSGGIAYSPNEFDITHESTADMRGRLGLSAREYSPQTFDEWRSEAVKRLENGELPKLLEDIRKGSRQFDKIDEIMLAMHIGELQSKAERTMSNADINAFREAVAFSENMLGSEAARILVARKMKFIRPNSLMERISEVMDARGMQPGKDVLSEAEKKEIKDQYEKEQAAKEKFHALRDAEAKEAEDKAADSTAKREFDDKNKSDAPEGKKDYNPNLTTDERLEGYGEKTKKAIKSHLKNIKDRIAKRKGNNSVGYSLSFDTEEGTPIVLKDNIDSVLSDEINQIVEELRKDGFGYEDTVREVQSLLQDSIDGLNSQDVIDVMAGKYNLRRTKKQAEIERVNLQRESKMLDQIMELEKESKLSKFDMVRSAASKSLRALLTNIQRNRDNQRRTSLRKELEAMSETTRDTHRKVISSRLTELNTELDGATVERSKEIKDEIERLNRYYDSLQPIGMGMSAARVITSNIKVNEDRLPELQKQFDDVSKLEGMDAARKEAGEAKKQLSDLYEKRKQLTEDLDKLQRTNGKKDDIDKLKSDIRTNEKEAYKIKTESKKSTDMSNRYDTLKSDLEDLQETVRQDKIQLEIANKQHEALVVRNEATKDNIKYLDDLIEKENFKPEMDKVNLKLSKEALAAQDEMIKLENDRVRKLMMDTYAPTRLKQILNAVNIFRAAMSTLDLSGYGRQGAIVISSYPKIAADAFKYMTQFVVSEKAYDRWMYNIQHEDPRFDDMMAMKLALTDINNPDINYHEESFQSTWLQKIPVYGKLYSGSERAYSGVLNKMRVDLYNLFADRMEERGLTPSNSEKQYRAMASYINTITGRGDLPNSVQAFAPFLNATLFSPRLQASRIKFMTYLANPSFYRSVPKEIRNAYFADLFKFAAWRAVVLSLTAAALQYGKGNDDDKKKFGYAPVTSSDFGKVINNNTRIDAWAGMQQYIVFANRFLSGKTTTTKGQERKLEGMNSKGDLALRFVRGKASPPTGMLIDLLFMGKDFMGNEIKWDWTLRRDEAGREVSTPRYLLEHLAPMAWMDAVELYKDNGALVGSAATLGNVLGAISTQTFEERPGRGNKTTSSDKSGTSSGFSRN